MKVTYVSTWDQPCGIAGYTAALKSAVAERGVLTDIRPIDRAGLRYFTLEELSAHYANIANSAADADVVHIQHEFGFFGASYGYRDSLRVLRGFLREIRKRDAAAVVTFHSHPFDFGADPSALGERARHAALRAHWRALIAREFKRGEGIGAIAHTRTARRLLIDSGLPSATVHFIHQGVPQPAPSWNCDSAIVKEQLGLAPDVKLLAIFGFLAGYKGYDTAIEALAHLPKDYHLAIVGGQHPFSLEPALDEVMALARRKKKLAERVHVTGYLPVERLRLYQQAADVCLAPYRTVPRVVSSAAVTWALASGKPVVASAIPPFVELNDEAGCVELVRPGAARELADAVLRVDVDPNRRLELITNSLRYAEANSWPHVAQQTVSLYEQLMPAKRSKRAPSRPEPSSPSAATTGFDPNFVEVEISPGVSASFAFDPASSDPIAAYIAAHGFPREPPIELALDLLREGDLLVDVGAHLGMFTIAAAAHGCQVLSIEGSARNATLVRSAVERNGFRHVEVLNAAAWDAETVLSFVAHAAWGHVDQDEAHFRSFGSTQSVKAVTLDSLVGGSRPVPRLVKLDIEGSELRALAGARRLLGRSDAPMFLFESNAWMLENLGGSAADLRMAFEAHGFDLYYLDRIRPGRLIKVSADELQPDCVSDYLAVKGQLEGLGSWTVEFGFDPADLTARLAAAACDGNHHFRMHAAREISRAAPELRSTETISRVLRRLEVDGHPDVRQAAWTVSASASDVA